MNTHASAYTLGNIFVVMVVVIAVAIAGYYIYNQVAPMESSEQEASDLDMVMKDLNVNFEEKIDLSGLENIKKDISILKEIESIEIII